MILSLSLFFFSLNKRKVCHKSTTYCYYYFPAELTVNKKRQKNKKNKCKSVSGYFRWKSGVASSLNYINIDSAETNPKMMPYPSWEANLLPTDGFSSTAETMGGRTNAPKATVVDGQLADNSSIISTFRIRCDECDRLWVMDTGLVDILGNPKQIAPPALVIFDLKTNQLIRRYTIPGSHIKDDTFFANVVRTFLFDEVLHGVCGSPNKMYLSVKSKMSIHIGLRIGRL